jgi:hypothetical protein
LVGAPLSPIGITAIKFSDQDHIGLAVHADGTFILVGKGDGTFRSVGSYAPSGLKVATGDFNRDKKADLVVVTGPGAGHGVAVLYGEGHGIFQAAHDTVTGQSPNEGPVDAAVGDFNEDGKPDLAVANIDGANVRILLGKGNGLFQSGETIANGITASGIQAGDLNGDGHLDLAVANESSSGSVNIFLGNGHGKFTPGKSFATGSLSFSCTLADFNGDGHLDIAVANYGSGNVSILLGKGDGTFKPAVNYAAGNSPDFVAVGDFNGDGKLDLAVSDRSTGTNIAILLGNGDGTFQPAVFYQAGGNPNSIAVGDFNGDKKLDLAVANTSESTVSLLIGNGDGTFQSKKDFPVSDFPWQISTADFDGDGNLDLAVAIAGGSAYDNVVNVLLGDGRGDFTSPMTFITGTDPHTVTIGDFDVNGSPDLAVINSLENTVTVLLNRHKP